MEKLANTRKFSQMRSRELSSHTSPQKIRERYERLSSIRGITKEWGEFIELDKIKDGVLYNLYITSVNEYVNSTDFYNKVQRQFTEDVNYVVVSARERVVKNTVHTNLYGVLGACRALKRKVEVDVDLARGGFYYVGVNENIDFYMLRDDDYKAIEKRFSRNIVRYGESESVVELKNFITGVLKRDADNATSKFVRGYPCGYDEESGALIFKFKNSKGEFVNNFEFLLRESRIKKEDTSFKGCCLLMMTSVKSKDFGGSFYRIFVTRQGAGFRSFEVFLRCKGILKALVKKYSEKVEEYERYGDSRAIITRDRLRIANELLERLTLKSIFLRKSNNENGIENTFVIALGNDSGRLYREIKMHIIRQLEGRFFGGANYKFVI